MLSIGKLVAGQERYYQEQIADGLDDYYTGRGEAPGRWVGTGAASLGLTGQVEEGQLGALIAGVDPRSGDVLREKETRVAALDLTFSAPKSISVLFALASEPVSRALVECHEEAVEAALSHLEDTAAFVRRGKHSWRFERAGGFVTAAFRHRMSRALDPQLHTHCVTANLAKGPDGRWTALHHPTLYRAAQTAGYLYQAHLRARVHERLGLQWGQVHKGAAEIEAIPRAVLEEFSRRRHEMRRAAEHGGFGLDTRKSAEKAAIATRERKKYGVQTHTWREEVQARASEHGLDTRGATKLIEAGERRVERGRLAREDPTRLREVDDALASPAGLTENDNTFDERAVLRAHAEAAAQGATIAKLRERAAGFAARGDVLATARGQMTTAELVGVERSLIAAAQGRAGEGVGRVEDHTLSRALAACLREMTIEQRAVVRATVTSGHGVQVIEALAGTGKTYTAGVLTYVYRQAGYDVLGVAPTGRAVRELTDEARIPSRTLAGMVLRIRNGIDLPQGCVVVLDEAGMAGTRETAILLEAARRARAKVVAIGDPGQLHSVQAGGWMRAVGRRTGVLKLSEVMRQRDLRERRALGQLHEGIPGGWLTWAREHDRVELGGPDATPERAVQEWAAAAREHGPRQAVLIARANDTRTALNERAREIVRGWGALGKERSYGAVAVAVGDRVICRRNDRDVDVDNGTRGTIRAVHRKKIVIETDARTVRELPATYVAEHVEHAYALTGHGMQGGTVEWAGVVAVPHELTRGWSYTALSRARARTRLFVPEEDEGWAHHEQARRDELAPSERAEKPTIEQLAASVARYMLTRDDEDLAVEQLPAAAEGRAGEPERAPQTRPADQEAPADAAEPEVSPPASLAQHEALTNRLRALDAQHRALETPELERMQTTARRERALIAHHDELAERLRALTAPARRRRDPHAAERRGLERAITGARAELAGLLALRARLEQETGPLEEVLAERARLRDAITRVDAEHARVRDELIKAQLAQPPAWARALLGEHPTNPSVRRVYEEALAAVAGYRLDHAITGPDPLGAAPDDPAAAREHRQATSAVARAHRRLGLTSEPYRRSRSPSLPHRYGTALGQHRRQALEALLRDASERAAGLPDDRLDEELAAGERALHALDIRAAARALRLEHQLAEHRQLAGHDAERARALQEQAKTLGWRRRAERHRLLDIAARLHAHLDRRHVDIERLELELARLRSTGRHPDQWHAQHAHSAAHGLAAQAEHERRHEAQIDRQAQRAALDPPAHVRELLGERPLSGVKLAQEWQRLTIALERHRLNYGIDVEREGPLGQPTHRQPQDKIAHDQARRRLAREINRLRDQRGLDPHPDTTSLTPPRPRNRGPDHAR